jgi:hypothetical protein
MEVIRTPEERFANLPDYPFEPHYAEIPDLEGGTLRMHYVDEGPRDGGVPCQTSERDQARTSLIFSRRDRIVLGITRVPEPSPGCSTA